MLKICVNGYFINPRTVPNLVQRSTTLEYKVFHLRIAVSEEVHADLQHTPQNLRHITLTDQTSSWPFACRKSARRA